MKLLFTIHHDVFDSQTLVAIGASDKDIVKWIKKNTNLEINDDLMDAIACVGEGRTAMHNSFTIMRFKKWKGSHYDLGVLAHEAFHLAEFIFHRIGVEHDMMTSGEVFAYFIGYTVEQVLEGIEEGSAA